jgi:hypothetical protein
LEKSHCETGWEEVCKKSGGDRDLLLSEKILAEQTQSLQQLLIKPARPNVEGRCDGTGGRWFWRSSSSAAKLDEHVIEAKTAA